MIINHIDEYMKEKIVARIKTIWPSALFFTFTLMLYGPLSWYLPNAEEMWFTIGIALKIIIPVSVITFCALIILAFFFPIKICNVYRNLLFGGTLALYIQGNYINISYGSGVMDGTQIVWEEYTSYAVVNTIVWVICLLIPWIVEILFKKVKKLRENRNISAGKIIGYLAVFLVLVQIPAMISQVFGYRENAQGDLQITTEGIFDLAEKDNTIVILVDTLDGLYFEQFLNDNPEFKDKLSGFTYYDNTLTAAGRTILSVPALFTGTPYLRESRYADYLNKIWSEDNLLSKLSQQGQDVRIFAGTTYFNTKTADYVSNFETGKVTYSNEKLLKKTYKMTLFKFAPHLLKKYFYVSDGEFDKAKNLEQSNKELYTSGDVAFFNRFNSTHFRVNSNYKGAFRYYHLRGAHSPYNVGPDGNTLKDSTREQQILGIFTRISEMLEELKQLDIFEDANIVIMADHGDINVAEWSTLLVKERGNKGENELVVSHVPASLFDIPVYIATQEGITLDNQKYGIDLLDLKEGMTRERHYFYNSSNSSKMSVVEYQTNSLARLSEELIEVGRYVDQSASEETYTLGTELSFGAKETGNQFVVDGFGINTGWATQINGPRALMKIVLSDLPKKDIVHVKIKTEISFVDRHIIIYVNEKKVYDKIIDSKTHKEGIMFDFESSTINDDKIVSLAIECPDIDNKELELPADERTEVGKVNYIIMSE